MIKVVLGRRRFGCFLFVKGWRQRKEYVKYVQKELLDDITGNNLTLISVVKRKRPHKPQRCSLRAFAAGGGGRKKGAVGAMCLQTCPLWMALLGRRGTNAPRLQPGGPRRALRTAE